MLWKTAEVTPKEKVEEPEKEEVLFPQGVSKPEPIVSTPAVSFQAAEEKACLLSRDTKLKGDLNTTDDVTLYGHLEGNITSTGKVRVLSTMTGDIRAKTIVLEGGEIIGTITAEGAVKVEPGSTVRGNVNAGELFIRAGAVIFGDVKAVSVSMEIGAKISGRLSVGER